jgi:hypothetical protein
MRRAALCQAAHIFRKARHVERPVLHSDVDVIGPDMRVLAPLRIGHHMAAVTANVIDRLILLEEFDRSVDALGHSSPSPGLGWRQKYPSPDQQCPLIRPGRIRPGGIRPGARPLRPFGVGALRPKPPQTKTN